MALHGIRNRLDCHSVRDQGICHHVHHLLQIRLVCHIGRNGLCISHELGMEGFDRKTGPNETHATLKTLAQALRKLLRICAEYRVFEIRSKNDLTVFLDTVPDWKTGLVDQLLASAPIGSLRRPQKPLDHLFQTNSHDRWKLRGRLLDVDFPFRVHRIRYVYANTAELGQFRLTREAKPSAGNYQAVFTVDIQALGFQVPFWPTNFRPIVAGHPFVVWQRMAPDSNITLS